MRSSTIVPGHHPGHPDVDPTKSERWAPSSGERRVVDRDLSRSAFPEARRFETIYPGTAASEEATAQMYLAREHDRTALARLAALLNDDMNVTVHE